MLRACHGETGGALTKSNQWHADLHQNVVAGARCDGERHRTLIINYIQCRRHTCPRSLAHTEEIGGIAELPQLRIQCNTHRHTILLLQLLLLLLLATRQAAAKSTVSRDERHNRTSVDGSMLVRSPRQVTQLPREWCSSYFGAPGHFVGLHLHAAAAFACAASAACVPVAAEVALPLPFHLPLPPPAAGSSLPLRPLQQPTLPSFSAPPLPCAVPPLQLLRQSLPARLRVGA